MEYIRSLSEESADGCFLCRYNEHPNDDDANAVLWRSALSLVVFNRFPYSNGHLLVSPRRHAAMPENLTAQESSDLQRLLVLGIDGLRSVMRAQGFNVGMNLGHCAGAGLPDHLHWHIVPRWAGDTNYMSVIANVRVIPESMQRNHAALRDWAAAAGIADPLGRIATSAESQA